MKELIHYIVGVFHQTEIFAVSVMASVVNMLVRPPKPNWPFYIAEFTISVTVAVLVGIMCQNSGLSKSISFAFVACSAIMARDLITFIGGFGDFMLDNREAIYKSLFRKVIGRGNGKKDVE